jgi:hypothetical protein
MCWGCSAPEFSLFQFYGLQEVGKALADIRLTLVEDYSQVSNLSGLLGLLL